MYLLPSPREIRIRDKQFYTLRYHAEICIDDNCDLAVNHYAKLLKNHILQFTGFSLPILKGIASGDGIYLSMNSEMAEEEYKLSIEKDKIVIQGGSNTAILYGVQTLRQIISQKGSVLPCLEIKDYPDIKHRGFYHDVTRGRVPTLAYLKELADKLSYYKINQLQLYIEHSYLFKDFSEVWRDDTPLTAEEILELDAYCRSLNIELIPSLSSFGHLYELLRTKTYAHLCELPNSDKEPFGLVARMQHHTIDTTNEESYQLITKMISEYMPLFSSKHFNICADETFDLGKGRSKQLADEIGTQKLYVGFLKRIAEFVVSKGKIPMFWGDIISRFPEAINELPKESICLNWGYAPDQRDYETKALAEAGATQYLCPGVGGWNQMINLIESSYKNIRLMCDYAYQYQGIGILNTDWGDFGHINHPEFSTAGIIYGATFSWRKTELSFDEINKQISALEYRDQSEQLIAVVAKLSTLSVFGWRNAVWFKELHPAKDEKSKEEIRSFLMEGDLSKVQTVNKSIENHVQELYRIINTMDSGKRYLVKPYLLAADGIHLLNRIGATIGHKVYQQENPATEDSKKLAAELEHWFYRYKEVWRSVSKESELYRLQNVINWYADYLREI
ncbi:MAG: family 20 glycosylhydrolase [Clostridiales bacterium]|nr:family 20 glycosylhydrolase [Clostridiales bacterium]